VVVQVAAQHIVTVLQLQELLGKVMLGLLVLQVVVVVTAAVLVKLLRLTRVGLA
tara:strand:+ start:485 stop:646 length:162 start_codon:yes stop_codon:yes gene_type:complete